MTRLEAGTRRDQLVTVGAELARRIPFDQIGADAVAQAAGVSRALVFHYFPTTRDLQVAILRSAAVDLVARIDLDPTASPADRLLLGIDGFVATIEEYPASYLALARSGGSDPVLLGVFEEIRAAVISLITDAVGIGELPPGIRLAVRGWIALVEECVLHWLEDRSVPRDQLIAYLQCAAIALLPPAISMAEGSLRPKTLIPGLIRIGTT